MPDVRPVDSDADAEADVRLPEPPAGWEWDMGETGDAPCLDCLDIEGAHIMIWREGGELGFYGFPEDFRIASRAVRLCLDVQAWMAAGAPCRLCGDTGRVWPETHLGVQVTQNGEPCPECSAKGAA